MAQAAPKVHTTRSADFVHAVADCTAAALNLTTISEKPKCAAQRVRFFNGSSDASETVTVTPELGPNQTPFNVTFLVGPRQDYTTEFPIKTIVSATDAGDGVVSAVVMWWYGTGIDINK